jgi:hypothetical protein
VGGEKNNKQNSCCLRFFSHLPSNLIAIIHKSRPEKPVSPLNTFLVMNSMTYTLYLARLFFLSLYQCLFCFVFSSENRKNFGFFTSGVVWLVGGETILVHGGGEP